MNLEDINNGEAVLRLNRFELITINNALNEICNGLHLDDDFELRIGAEVEDVQNMLSNFGQIIDTLDTTP